MRHRAGRQASASTRPDPRSARSGRKRHRNFDQSRSGRGAGEVNRRPRVGDTGRRIERIEQAGTTGTDGCRTVGTTWKVRELAFRRLMTWPGVRPGSRASIRATTPATCGAAMLVPMKSRNWAPLAA